LKEQRKKIVDNDIFLFAIFNRRAAWMVEGPRIRKIQFSPSMRSSGKHQNRMGWKALMGHLAKRHDCGM
jgi:hypothetical protein